MSTSYRISVIHGPNLNRLGVRERHIYGDLTLAELDERLIAHGKSRGAECVCRQSNHEGQLIDWVHEADANADGLLVNFGAFSHSSLALSDALASISPPAVEVHLSQVLAREPLRKQLITAEKCIGMLCGFGANTYVLGLDALIGYLNTEAAR